MERERFLPIGSVVLLKNATKPVMITGYSIIGNAPSTENPEEITKKMYEYGCCVYPEGVLSTNLIGGFDHDQIAEILFVGYETEAQIQISTLLNENYEKLKEKFETEGTL